MKPYYIYPFNEHEIIQTPNLWSTHQNYNYIIKKGKKAWIIDPGDPLPIQKTLTDLDLELMGIYLTHHHHDHTGASEWLQKKWSCPSFGLKNEISRLPHIDHPFLAGDQIKIADLNVEVIFTPGHTLGLCAFYFPEKKWLFSSDLIFSMGCGRVFEGSYEQMLYSLKIIRDLDDQTIIFSSHEYTEKNILFCLSLLPDSLEFNSLLKITRDKMFKQIPTVPMTLGEEKKLNPFLRWDDQDLKKSLNLMDLDSLDFFSHLRELRNHF